MADLGLDAPLRRQLLELAESSRRQAGRLAEIAGMTETPRKARAPARPKAAATARPVTGEEIAAALLLELAHVFAEDVLRVRYAPPAVLVDYLPLHLKLTVRRQHAIAGLSGAPDEVMVDQTTGPRGMFRAKTGTPREVIGYVVRFFQRLKARPAEVAPEAAVQPLPGGRSRRGRHGTRATLRLLALHRAGPRRRRARRG